MLKGCNFCFLKRFIANWTHFKRHKLGLMNITLYTLDMLQFRKWIVKAFLDFTGLCYIKEKCVVIYKTVILKQHSTVTFYTLRYCFIWLFFLNDEINYSVKKVRINLDFTLSLLFSPGQPWDSPCSSSASISFPTCKVRCGAVWLLKAALDMD